MEQEELERRVMELEDLEEQMSSVLLGEKKGIDAGIMETSIEQEVIDDLSIVILEDDIGLFPDGTWGVIILPIAVDRLLTKNNLWCEVSK